MNTHKHSNGNGTNGHATHSHVHTHAAAVEAPANEAPTILGAPPKTTNPSTAVIESLLQQLDTIASSLGVQAKPLTIAERRRLLRLRPGGGDHAATVVALAKRYGLAIPGVDPASVADDTQFVTDVAMLESRLEVVRGLVSDMSLEAQSRIWRAGTTAYTMLARLVPQFPALQRELTPMASFLAIGYKNAPTSIRPQEKAAMKKRRAEKKKAGAPANGGAAPANAAPSTPSTNTAAPPPTPTEPPKTGA
jgi:hypothetical protein